MSALLSVETSVSVYHSTGRKNHDLHITLRYCHYPSTGYYPEPEESRPLPQVLLNFHVVDHLLHLVSEKSPVEGWERVTCAPKAKAD